MIYIAGPALNLITCILFRVIGYENYILRYLSDVNFYIFLFNMLPVLPLDAGNIFFNVFSYFKGVINSAKIMKRFGKLVGFLIILIGIDVYKRQAYNSAKVISAIKPEFVGFLTLMVEEGTKMYDLVHSGKFRLLSPSDVVE